MGIQWQDGGYSADVETYLLVDGRKVPVSHVGPDTVILRSDDFVPSGHAQIVIVIDGREEVYDVILSPIESESLELAYG